MLLIVLLTLFFSDPRASASEDGLSGLTKPLFESARENGMDKDVVPAAPKQLHCYVYANFAIVEGTSPSLIGSESIEVRTPSSKRHPTVPGKPSFEPDALCAANFRGTKRKIHLEEGGYVGALENYLFFTGEAHGGATPFSVYDAMNGKKLFSANYDATHRIDAIVSGGTLSVVFHKMLSQKSRETCIPTVKDRRCWDQILEENGVPAEKDRPLPDCQRLFEKDPSLKKNFGTQFSIPVEWNLSRTPALTYLKGDLSCGLNP